MNRLDLQKFVQENPRLVSSRPCGGYPGLSVLKYQRRVFYENTWNEYLEECRGTIVDGDFNVVSRPFKKIYNFRIEDKAPEISDDTLVTAYEKVNGFLVSMTWYNGDILVSTTGSTDSDHVRMARELMVQQMSMADWQIEVCAVQGVTLMFEAVHPSDPHIVPEESGLYFLGYRENTWEGDIRGHGVDIAAHWADYGRQLKCRPVKSLVLPMGELLEKVRTCRHEGYVVYTADGRATKIKSPYYLTSKWVARNPRTEKLVDLKRDIKLQIDEEYHGLVDWIRSNIVEYTLLNEQERLAAVRGYLEKISE